MTGRDAGRVRRTWVLLHEPVSRTQNLVLASVALALAAVFIACVIAWFVTLRAAALVSAFLCLAVMIAWLLGVTGWALGSCWRRAGRRR